MGILIRLKSVLVFLPLFFFVQVGWGAKRFVYCSEASPSIFNPQLATDGATFNATRSIYNRLVEFEHGGTKVVPALAKSWKFGKATKNGKDIETITFELRKDVDWHTTEYFTPTRKFNADDVVYTFKRMSDASHPMHKVGGGVYEYFDGMSMDKVILDVVKVADHVVRFELSRPEAPMIANLAMDFSSITSKEYAEKLLAERKQGRFDQYPVGTGPFIFEKYVKDSMIQFKANDKFFMGKPKIEILNFLIVTNQNVRYQKLRAGECHLATDPAPQDIAAISSNPKLQVMSQPGLNIFYIAFNTEKAPFNNPKVRKAIAHAMNRKSYVEAVFLGNAQVAKNPMPPTMWGYNSSVKDIEYDIEKSKALLKEAGFEKGLTADFHYMTETRPYNPNGKKIAEMIQADLSKVGVKLVLSTAKWATYLVEMRKGNFDIGQMGWTGDNGDPDNFLSVLLSCDSINASNYARWCDKEYTNITQRARVTTDIRKRTDFYLKAQERFRAESPWVPLVHTTVFKAMAKNVTGYKMSPFGVESFHAVDLK